MSLRRISSSADNVFEKHVYCIEIIFLKYLEQIQPLKTLKLPYTFRSAIFFEFRFFGLSNDPNEISKGENCSPCLVNIFYSIDSGLHWTKKRIYSCLRVEQMCGKFGALNLDFICTGR